MSNKMFCESCGARIPDNAKFCEECGSSVSLARQGMKIQSTYPGVTMQPGKTDNGMQKGLIIGIAVGVVILLILVVVILFRNDRTAEEGKEFFARGNQTVEESDYLGTYEAETKEDFQGYTKEYMPSPPGIVQSGKVVDESALTENMDASNGDYIIPDSDVRYITDADLEGLTQEELRIARNELYARHGRMFKDEILQEYFNSKSWYAGTIAPDNFTQEMLSDIERANAVTISDFEARKGY